MCEIFNNLKHFWKSKLFGFEIVTQKINDTSKKASHNVRLRSDYLSFEVGKDQSDSYNQKSI